MIVYYAAIFTFWFTVWIFLAWPPTIIRIVEACVISFIVSFLTIDVFHAVRENKASASGGRTLPALPVRIAWFVWYLAVFLWECIKANLDVAMRVIHPSMPIRPGTVRIKTSLRSNLGLTLLANSLTLTPGRTTIDIDKERGYIYIHRLYIQEGEDISSERMDAVDKFEHILHHIFG